MAVVAVGDSVTHGDNVASPCPSVAGCTTKSQSQSLASSEAGELGLGQSLTQATVCRTRHLASTPSTRPEPEPGHRILASDRWRQNIGVYYLVDMKQTVKETLINSAYHSLFRVETPN